MKKTMIAMAVAGVVAAPMASAEVSISGVVEQTFIDDDASSTGWDSATFNMLNFKASEDLGNGMTAFAKYNFLNTNGKTSNDTDTQSGTIATQTGGDNVVGLSGDFGTVVLGTMEDFTEGKAMSRLTLDGPAEIEAANNNAGRTAGGMAYVSPSISGLTIGVAGFADASTSGSENLDATDLMAHYVNGPLDIIVTQEKQDKDSSLTAASNDDQKTTTMGAAYTMGDLKVGMMMIETDNAGGDEDADSEDIAFRLDYTMGNNKIVFASINDETATVAGVKTDVDINALEVKHSFSSRTSAYVGFQDHETGDNDKSYVGLIHKF